MARPQTFLEAEVIIEETRTSGTTAPNPRTVLTRWRGSLMAMLLLSCILSLVANSTSTKTSVTQSRTNFTSAAQNLRDDVTESISAEIRIEPLPDNKNGSGETKPKNTPNPIPEESKVRVEGFLSKQFYKYPAFVQSQLTKEDLPLIYSYLGDFQRARQWNELAYAVSILEEPQKAFNFLSKYSTESWDWSRLDSSKIDSAVVVLERVMIAGELANYESAISGSFLQKALSKDGAEELLGSWDESRLPMRIPSRILLEAFRGSVATGMVCSGNPEYVSTVEDAWRSVAAMSTEEQTRDENDDLFRYAEALGWREYISEMGGLEEAMREYVELSIDDRWSLKTSYTVRYLTLDEFESQTKVP